MLNISETAQSEIKKVETENPGKRLRIIMAGFGWGGPRLGLALDEFNEEDLHTFDNTEIMIDEQTEMYLRPSSIECYSTQNNSCQLYLQPAYTSC